jgi:hypothetical protein
MKTHRIRIVRAQDAEDILAQPGRTGKTAGTRPNRLCVRKRMLHSLFALALLGAASAGAPPALSYLPAPAHQVNHGAGLVRLRSGDLLACWYSGPAEADPDVAILCAEGRGAAWAAPRVAAPARFAPDIKSLGNVALARDRSGRLVMIFGVVRSRRAFGVQLCRSWACGRIEASVSSDEGRTWSAPLRLDDRGGALPRSRPLSHAGRPDMIPVYLERGRAGVLTTDLAEMTADGFGPMHSALIPGRSIIQPSLTIAPDGAVWAYMRDLQRRRVFGARLGPGATEWTPAAPTNLENPSSPVEAFTDRSGAIVLIYNPSRRDRRTLALARSRDGLSFRRGCDLVPHDHAGDVAYPSIVEQSPGAWSAVFSTHGKTRIAVAHFDQAWLDSCFR